MPNIKTPGGIRTRSSKGGGPWLRLRNLHDPILPFVCGRSGPYQHESLNDIGQWRSLFGEKEACTLAIRFKEVAEVARHRPEIGDDKNPILTRGEGQDFGAGNSFQRGLMRRKKVDCRLTAETRGDYPIVETGVRQEADIRQLRRETVCCRIRSNAVLTSGGVGWAAVNASSSRSRSKASPSTSS